MKQGNLPAALRRILPESIAANNKERGALSGIRPLMQRFALLFLLYFAVLRITIEQNRFFMQSRMHGRKSREGDLLYGFKTNRRI